MKYVYVFLGCLFLLGCSNKKEYLYNETLAREYYAVSEQFEKTYKTLSSGEYKTQDEWTNEFAKNPTLRDAENLKNRVKVSKEVFDLLEPSDAAKEMHAKMDEFFKKVSSDYANSLELYGNINCDCPEKKDSVSQSIHRIYREISTIEDSALELQKKYFEEIGMKVSE